MHRSGHIFITGITGSVGSEIVRWLRNYASNLRLTAVLRAGSTDTLHKRWDHVLRAAGVTAPASWRPIAGDVTLPQLGLSHSEFDVLRTDVTHLIHAAADVRFLAPLEDLRRVNTEGTRNVLDFAARCSRLVQCAHLSTLFVAGRRTGIIREHELEHDTGFINSYEHSKYEAELIAQKFMKLLPLSVYRLALLPGRHSDGFVHQFGAFHQVLYYYHRGWLLMLPGDGDARVDMAPIDWATDVLMRMFLGHFEPSRTYHICSGDSAVQMSEFVALTSRCFSDRPALAPLELVDPTIYDRFLNAFATRGTARSQQMVRMLNSTVPYAVLSRVFDREGTPPPAFRVYYPSIARYCLHTDWGRQTTTLPAC